MPITRLRREAAPTLIRFLTDRCGGVAPIFGLAFVPLLGAVGAAVDYSRAGAIRTAMQAALDATALTLAKQNVSSDALNQTATSLFNANFVRSGVQDVQVSGSSSPASGGSTVSLSAGGAVRTHFMRIFGFATVPINTSATAVAQADGLGCVLALDRTASGSVTGQGSTTVDLKGCSLYDNSNSPTAVSVGGSAKISALSVGVVGGVAPGSNGLTTDQGIHTGMGVITDPYKDDAFPPVGACTDNNFKAKDTGTIDPGVYCGGMTINAGVTVTLNPGIYYLDGGDLSLNGGATLTGTGVTLVFTSHNRNDYATASINGNGTLNLTAPQSGPTAGIVMFGDRNMPVGTSFKLNGSSSQYLGGAVYVPSGAIQYAGGAATSTTCTQLIGNTVTFTGNSSVSVNCSSYKTKPFSAWVVRLTS